MTSSLGWDKGQTNFKRHFLKSCCLKDASHNSWEGVCCPSSLIQQYFLFQSLGKWLFCLLELSVQSISHSCTRKILPKTKLTIKITQLQKPWSLKTLYKNLPCFSDTIFLVANIPACSLKALLIRCSWENRRNALCQSVPSQLFKKNYEKPVIC